MLFTGFQLYDPGSSILGSEDLRGKMVAHPKQDAACVMALHCCCRGGGRVHCDFCNPNLALESKIHCCSDGKKPPNKCVNI